MLGTSFRNVLKNPQRQDITAVVATICIAPFFFYWNDRVEVLSLSNQVSPTHISVDTLILHPPEAGCSAGVVWLPKDRQVPVMAQCSDISQFVCNSWSISVESLP